MQRTFITTMPETIKDHQIIVNLPRYEVPLTKALVRKDVHNYEKFSRDNESIAVITSLNNIKMFVDELSNTDKDIDTTVRVPYTNYVGLQFLKTQDAVKWARGFVRRHFPGTEERLIRKALLNIPFDKTEIIWLGGEKFLSFVKTVAISPSTDDLVSAVDTSVKPALTREEATKLRADIASKKSKKD